MEKARERRTFTFQANENERKFGGCVNEHMVEGLFRVIVVNILKVAFFK